MIPPWLAILMTTISGFALVIMAAIDGERRGRDIGRRYAARVVAAFHEGTPEERYRLVQRIIDEPEYTDEALTEREHHDQDRR